MVFTEVIHEIQLFRRESLARGQLGLPGVYLEHFRYPVISNIFDGLLDAPARQFGDAPAFPDILAFNVFHLLHPRMSPYLGVSTVVTVYIKFKQVNYFTDFGLMPRGDQVRLLRELQRGMGENEPTVMLLVQNMPLGQVHEALELEGNWCQMTVTGHESRTTHFPRGSRR